jgi:hypothetical protein
MFCGDDGTDGSELAAGVGDGDGQPGSGAMAGRLLTANHPCETRVSLGGEARSYAGRWSVTAGGATRCGGGGPEDRPPPEKPGTEGSRIIVSVPNMFYGAATRSACSTDPSTSRYLIFDMLP